MKLRMCYCKRHCSKIEIRKPWNALVDHISAHKMSVAKNPTTSIYDFV